MNVSDGAKKGFTHKYSDHLVISDKAGCLAGVQRDGTPLVAQV